MPNQPICIYSEPGHLKEGLFGQVFLFLFEILPYLHSKSIFPAWEIRSALYGVPPDYLTVPGVLDLAYELPSGPYKRVSMNELRERHCWVLGNDWAAVSRIWNAYFKVPQRVVACADAVGPLDKAIGLHFRGTDKQTSSWDSNPISQDQYLTLAQEFLAGRPDIETIFAATDEFTFVEKLRKVTTLPIINLGEVSFHKGPENPDPHERADRALLDCVLLSRCAVALETSSALPSFAKILNPDLQLYRTAASKLFVDIPYFPVAYVPKIPLTGGAAKGILEVTMKDDWTDAKRAGRFKKQFGFYPRNRIKNLAWELTETFTGL
jgi:hypothetical protein